MLQPTSHGPFTRLFMARAVFGRPLYTVNAYLIDGLLVDTGCPATAGELVAWCRGQDVRLAVNTHHHEDHAGGDELLQRALGLAVYATPATAAILAKYYRLQLYRWAVWGQPRDVQVQMLGTVLETEHYRFEVHATPGHCPDHVCLFEPKQGWLFSGDLFMHERVRYLRADEDAWTTIDSLRRAAALRPQLMICAHAGFVEDACGALERKIAFWEGLAEQARALQQAGLDAAAITARLLGPEGAMTTITRGHFSKINLVRSLLAGPASRAGAA